MRNISIIKWGANRYNDSYWYGSEVVVEKTQTYFSSPLMPVGGKIKTWHSHTNYWESRTTPMLPLLVRHKAYQVALFLEENADNHFQVTVEFYDEFHHEIATEYFDELSFVLTYPAEAVSYKINLINNSHEALIFYLMVITEVGDVCGLSRHEGFSILTLAHPAPENGLEIVMHYLVKETSAFSIQEEATAAQHFFVSEAETSFLNSTLEIVKQMKKATGAITLSQGLNFELLPDVYQLLPHILSALLPEIAFSTTIPFAQEMAREAAIGKYVEVLRQMLETE